MELFVIPLIILFALLVLGSYMKTLPEVSFTSVANARTSKAAFDLLINSLSSNCDTDSVKRLADLCHQFVDSPSEALLRLILSEFNCQGEKEFYTIYQLQALFKKNASFDLGIDTRGKALDTFFQAEKLCLETNRKLRQLDDPHYAERAHLIFQMSRKISSVLGPVPSLTELPFGFGPGTNVGCSKSTSVRFKLEANATGTAGACELLCSILTDTQATPADVFSHWPGLHKMQVVSGSYWTAVPKTALTDRGINVEPIINTYLQKGMGSVIRDRLRNVGVNLNDQSKNQRLAQKGSRDGSLATIDLSMASDTISYLLVMDLLSHEWFDLLDSARCSRCTLPDGSDVILEKFSAMGNGFTFELESLIFWALLSVVCEGSSDISVYGDDLICPVEYFDKVLHAISLLGFVPNPEKSFGTGEFRESCGKDYLGGTDVRPLFLKEAISVKEIFRIHNYFARTCRLEVCPELIKLIPRSFRIYGPDGYGDGHLIGDTPLLYDKRGWEPFYRFKTFQARPRLVRKPLQADWGAFLYMSRVSSDRTIGDSLYTERCTNPVYRIRNVRVTASH